MSHIHCARRLSPFVTAAMCLAIVGLPEAFAAEIDVGATIGAGQTDNIRRVAIGEESETVVSAALDAAIFHDSSHLYADVVADISYLDYLDNTYEREVVGNGDAQFFWRIVPERFEWLLRDNFGQVRSDPFAPVTPDTRENINYLTTGPDLTAALGQRTRLRLFGRYSNVDYQETPADNDRYGAGTALIRELSGGSYLSLNVQGERVEYQDLPTSDYIYRQAFARYRLQHSRTELILEAGYNDIGFEGRSSEEGPLFRLDLSRQLTAATTVALNAGYELTDPALDFRSLESSQGGSVDSASVIPGSDPYEEYSGGFEWRFIKLRTGMHAGIRYSEENYLRSTEQDRTRTSARAGLSRRITNNLTADLSGEYSHEEFSGSGNDFDELVGRFSLDWRLGRWLSTELSYEYFDRSAEAGLDEYQENRVWLQFRYGTERVPLQARTTRTAEAW